MVPVVNASWLQMGLIDCDASILLAYRGRSLPFFFFLKEPGSKARGWIPLNQPLS